jgi:hypothetical protein
MADSTVEPIDWERALMAAEKVKERLRRAARALDTAGIPSPVPQPSPGVSPRVDEDAIRNTPDGELGERLLQLLDDPNR